MNPYLRIIGDVHGRLGDYCNLANKAEYSIQLGDLGFDYSGIMELNSNKHKVIAGNHDNYLQENGRFVNQTAHFLGDYGVYNVPDFGDIFFIRGGRSIDRGRSNIFIENWWQEEELNYKQGLEALHMYSTIKPSFVISHECPSFLIDQFSSMHTFRGQLLLASNTAKLLDQMFDTHQPKHWLFGHHHKDFKINFKSTNFKCVNIMKYVDFDKKQD